MAASKTILVTSASGNIGRSLIPLLLSHPSSPKLVLPTRSSANLKSTIPALSTSENNVIIEEGTVRDPVWFQSLLSTHSVTDVLLNLTNIDELYTGLLLLDAITQSPTVKHLVYISIAGNLQSAQDFENIVTHRPYPHIFAKVVIENRLRLANLPFNWTVLGGGFYFTNEAREKPAILNGAFNTPILTGKIAKTSPEDIAFAADKILTSPSPSIYAGKKFSIGSKHGYTGAETQAIWSKALGREIKSERVTQQSMDAWEQRMRSVVSTDDGRAFARDLKILYLALEGRDLVLAEGEYEEQVGLLGREPKDYESWVGETAEGWLAEGK